VYMLYTHYFVKDCFFTFYVNVLMICGLLSGFLSITR